MTTVQGGRRLDAYSRELLGEGREVLINPDFAQITKALSRVQARARTNLLTPEEAGAVFRRVAQEGESSAHAGVKDCPRGFKFGLTSTVIQVARLTDSMIGCAIGRQQVLPGEMGTAPVVADPFERPRQWLKEIVTTFWTRLDDRQIAAIQQKAVAAAMELAARRDRGRTHAHGAERAGVKRKLQLEALFRSTLPIYVSEFSSALAGIAKELRVSKQDSIVWRDFQKRWPSVAARYKRDLLGVFRQGVARTHELAAFRVGSPKYTLSFTTWSGAQTVFSTTQIVFQICSAQLSTAEGARHRSTYTLRKALRELAERSLHPVTPETVGWLRVHVDDLHRLAFVDEVQSDVMEYLLERSSDGDGAAQTLSKELADWQVNGFTTIRQWASAIGYRVAMHSEESAARIESKTRSARKWNLYYGALIKRFGLVPEAVEGYPGPICVGN